MQQLSIGAVAKLTQIPAHTIRKWESRHGIAVPERTPTGRRVYNETQVETLKLVKQLVASGHALAHLKDLDLDELAALAGMHKQTALRLPAASLVLVGPNVSRRLTSHTAVARRFGGALREWLGETRELDHGDSVIVEAETLPSDLVAALVRLRAGVADLLVVYAFASTRTLNELAAADIRFMPGPASEADLLLRLEIAEPALPVAERAQRFTPDELARVATLNPGLGCECPNHIAKLLMEISSFEKYSRECIDTDPDERALHTELATLSARARALFEDALIAVAAADGIALSVRD